MMVRARWAVLAFLLGGCVYYNGMYNAKRLAGSARKAERDGRVFEANNLWSQVVIRADSLVTRHPDSKYVDEALVLKGIALARTRQCPAAVAPLGRAFTLPPDAEVVEDATLALGRCQLELGDPKSAEALLARVVETKDKTRRREARMLQGRALRLLGRHEEAVVALEGATDPRAVHERMLALAGAGRRDAVLAMVDSALAKQDTLARWDTVVVAVGLENPVIATAVVDRVVRFKGVAPASRARLFYEDGERLVAVDQARARARLGEAAQVEQGGDASERAGMRLIRLDLSRVAAVADLRPVVAALDERINSRSPTAGEATQLRETIQRVAGAADSAAAGAARADLHLFLAAESARDTLAAPVLAASLFRSIVDLTPDSPYAPKAILAGQALDSVWGQSALPLLEGRYAASPYAALLRGEEPYGYQELEDSLRTFAHSSAPGQRRTTPRRPRARNDSLPDRRPGQTPRRGLEP